MTGLVVVNLVFRIAAVVPPTTLPPVTLHPIAVQPVMITKTVAPSPTIVAPLPVERGSVKHVSTNAPVMTPDTVSPEVCTRCVTAVLRNAMSQLGTRYVHGGADPSKGFDCGGLVMYSYQAGCGSALPHGSKALYETGERVAKEDLRPGDLVFFRFPRVGWHVGIYIGNGEFIHAPNHKRVVSVNSLLSKSYTVTYMGARRILTDAVVSSQRCPPAEPFTTALDFGSSAPAATLSNSLR
jgi:cell wall-associated NlpC family hydrolase